MLILDNTSAGVQKYRMIEPNILLKEKYNFNVKLLQGQIHDNELDDHKIIFTHFTIAQNEKIVEDIKKLKSKGLKLIIDVDDYWDVSPSHHLYYFYKKNNLVQKTVDLFKFADGITCSTKYLASAIRPYNKNICVLPNSLDPDSYDLKIKNRPSELTRIGWSGGSSHYDDIKLFRGLGIGSKLKSENIQFILAGFDSKVKNEKGEIVEAFDQTVWKKYEQIITNNYSVVSDGYKNHLLSANKYQRYFNEKNERYRRVWTKSISKYLKNMNEIDLFIVPLIDNEFNKYKSELKVIEAGFFKKPVICSNVRQYKDVIKHGKNGFLVKEKRAHKDFTKYIKKYINSPDMMQDHGERLYQICIDKFNLQKNSKKRLEFYENL